jgi:hypothetical protein
VRSITLAGLLLNVTFIYSCGFTPNPPQSKVLVIAEDPSADANGRILLPNVVLPPGQGRPQLGQALITGNGTHLYRVDNVQVMPDGSFQITTSQSTLSELGIEGEFRFAEPLTQSLPGKLGPQQLAVDANLQLLDVRIPFARTLNLTSDGSVSAEIDGVFELNGVFHLAFDVGAFAGVRTFSSYIGGDSALNIDAFVSAEIGTNISQERAVGQPISKLYSGFIGVVPVVVKVTAQLYVGLEGRVEGAASFESGVNARANLKVGAGYDSSRPDGNRWRAITTSGFDWGYDLPGICANGSLALQVYLRPHFEVQLYSVAGPTFDLKPYAHLAASARGCLFEPVEYQATLTVGAAGYARIRADILDRFVLESPLLTVFDVSTELATWQNIPLLTCPNGACGLDENCSTCPQDCPCPIGQQCQNGVCVDIVTCPNGICGPGENCSNCAEDCPCPPGQQCQNGSCVTILTCPNGVCGPGENCSNCPQDCPCPSGQTCSNGTCVFCAAGFCGTGQNCSNCPLGCPCPSGQQCQSGSCVTIPTCPNGVCGLGENCSNCPQDCPCPSGQQCQSGSCVTIPTCPNGVCGFGENCSNCPQDCPCPSGQQCQNGSCIGTHPTISSVSPNPVPGRNCRQELNIFGSNFTENCLVELRDGYSTLFNDLQDRTSRISSTHVRVTANFTTDPDDSWDVRIKNSNGQLSAWHRFTVTGRPDWLGTDDCTLAPAIGNGTWYGSNINASTTSGLQSCVSTGKDVWWLYVPPSTGRVTIDTCDSNFDTVLSVHSPLCVTCDGPSNYDACNDDHNACGTLSSQSRVTIDVTRGNPKLIRVGGWQNSSGNVASGTIVLRISP